MDTKLKFDANAEANFDIEVKCERTFNEELLFTTKINCTFIVEADPRYHVKQLSVQFCCLVLVDVVVVVNVAFLKQFYQSLQRKGSFTLEQKRTRKLRRL